MHTWKLKHCWILLYQNFFHNPARLVHVQHKLQINKQPGLVDNFFPGLAIFGIHIFGIQINFDHVEVEQITYSGEILA
jgi:hypothetical protein